MFTPSIKSLVTKALDAVIKDRQLHYDAEVRRIDEEAVEAVDKIITEAETKKVVLKEEIVESIISKFR